MNGTAHYTLYSLTSSRPLTASIMAHFGRSSGTTASPANWSTSSSPSIRILSAVSSTTMNWLKLSRWTCTGVKQGCILSPILFSLAIDWVMRCSTQGKRQGIQWTLTSELEDLDYADDIGLLSHWYQDAQLKTESLTQTPSTIGLKVNEKKTKVLRKNAITNNPVTVSGRPIKDVHEFVYLGSKVTTDGDCDVEVTKRISKVNQAFAMLRPIWRSTGLGIHTKIRIFKSNILSVLLNCSECWKSTTSIE